MLEVYPHAAMLRFLGLDRILKYKRGRVAERRVEFGRLQELLRERVPGLFPELEWGEELERLLGLEWSKKTEDLTDAVVCALVASWHWKYQGKRSQVVGDEETGWLVVRR
ncbi:MAG: DUF429 domain-containing protein [Blastochloris sp.]|nr:DUF429 domain-containing protein [Blastochloris sp.]